MDRVRQLLAGESRIQLGLRATADQIAQAERTLGLRLPASFVEFLTTWGAIEIGMTKVLSFSGGNETAGAAPGFVETTLAARTRVGLPPHFIICVIYANDRYVCLDTFSMRYDEASVVLWDGRSRLVIQTLGPTFGDFLHDQVQGQLAMVGASRR
jgi:hypothetical protein